MNEMYPAVTEGTDCVRLTFVRMLALKAAYFTKNRSLHQGISVVFDQGLCSLATFVTGALIARGNTKEQYGLFVLGFTVIGILMLMQRSLISVPFTVHSPHLEKNEKSNYFGSVILHQAWISLFCLIGFICAAGIIKLFGGNNSTFRAVLAMAAASGALLFRDFVRSALLADLKTKLNLRMGIISNVGIIAFLCVAYLRGVLSVSVACIIVGICAFLPAGFCIFRLKNQWVVKISRLAEHFKTNWRFGRWTLASVTANSLCLRSIPWFILFYCGRDAVAVAGVLLTVAGIIMPFVTGVAGFITPKLANKLKSSDVHQVVRRGLNIVSISAMCGVLYVAIIAFCGERFVELIFTSSYAGYKLALIVMALAIALEGINIPLKSLLRVIHLPHVESHGSFIALVMGLSTCLCFIPMWGILGGALAMCVGRATQLGYSLFYITRKYQAGIAVKKESE